jgi:FkbM family methyltransferase
MNMLHTLNKRGFIPKTVIDCGASVGDWTRAVLNAFPGAEFVMIEPREACSKHLQPMASDSVLYVRELLGSIRSAAILYDHGEQSSVYRDYNNNKWGEPTKFKTERLDNIVIDPPTPIMIKLDVQGAELEVLKGAEKILGDVEVIFMEVSLFPFMAGIPLITDVLVEMDELGFMVYDVFDRHLRPIDGRVGQLDICFVAKTSQLNDDIRWFVE